MLLNGLLITLHKHEEMAYESVKLTTQVHNFENFKLQMNFIWDQNSND